MDLTKLLTKSDAPWPEPEIAHINLNDAKLLQEDYAAALSETTAVMTYMYQAYIIHLMDDDLAGTIEHIAISEMHHHEVLGEMIVSLGGNPIIGGKKDWWSGSYINYTKNIRNMLIHNINIEQGAIDHYRYTISRLYNDCVKQVIERIILDEEIHLETFKALLDYVTFWK